MPEAALHRFLLSHRKGARGARAMALVAALGSAVAMSAAAAAEPYVLDLEIRARFKRPEFARAPFQAGLAVLRFAEEQAWAEVLPQEPTQLSVEDENVTGTVRVEAAAAPAQGASLSFQLGGERFDVALDGARFERVPLATGSQWQARLPVVLQLDDPTWVGLSAELIEIAGLRPRLQLQLENRSTQPYALPALQIRGERRRTRRPADCAAPPEAELPRVQWFFRVSSGSERQEGMSVVPVRVGGCELQWMALDLKLDRELPPGSEIRLMALPLQRPELPRPPAGDARVDELAGWDSIRVSVSPPGRELPPEVVLRPRGR